MTFRRNFDAEAVARARGERPRGIGGGMGQTTPTALPSPQRTIILHRDDNILAELLTFSINLKPAGEDWHISARSPEEHERVLAHLKLRGLHGIIRTRRAG